MARGKIQGFVEQGGHTVLTDGRISSDKVQQSFPFAGVSVFDAGTAVLSTIFSDEAGTPKANPFLADSTGFWFFWADQGRYDVQFSGAGITTPFTIFSLETVIAAGLVDPGSNGFLARTAPNIVAARIFQGTTSAITITNPDGAGNPVFNLDTNLNFSGKTIDGGTYTSPGISNFQNALHNHENSMGGGQLNASNVFSTGTVPIARLPIMVGATGVTPGTAGLVPAPAAGQESLFLRGDGTWQAAGGGGGGTPASPNMSLQYNNAGAFGGVTGTSSDGTQVTWTAGVLRATSPRITTNILDTNGNAIVSLNAIGSAVNNFQVANAASGGHPVLSTVGAGADLNLVLTPKGAGILDTSGNFRITNNAPQITLIDVNDSKTIRMSVSGANWDFTNDTLGSVPIRIDTNTNQVTLPGILSANGNITIQNTNPSITFDDTVGTDAKIDHEAGILRFGSTSANQFTLNVDTGVATFTQIPILPASDPTTANQAVRKQYVDDRKIWWSMNWFIADPSTFPLNSFNLSQKVLIPTGTNTLRAQFGRGIFNTGTASGSFTVEIRKHTFDNQSNQTLLGTVTFNPGTVGVGQGTLLAVDHTFTADDWVFIILTARSSPLQRDVTISLAGFQTPVS